MTSIYRVFRVRVRQFWVRGLQSGIGKGEFVIRSLNVNVFVFGRNLEGLIAGHVYYLLEKSIKDILFSLLGTIFVLCFLPLC